MVPCKMWRAPEHPIEALHLDRSCPSIVVRSRREPVRSLGRSTWQPRRRREQSPRAVAASGRREQSPRAVAASGRRNIQLAPRRRRDTPVASPRHIRGATATDSCPRGRGDSAMASSRIASSAASASRCSASRTLRFCAIWRTSDMVERSAARGYVSSCAAGAISLLGPWEGCLGRGAARRNSKRARSRRRRGEASSRARWAAFWASPLVQNHDLFTRRRRRKAEHRAA